MSKLFQNKAFKLGVFFGIFLMLVFNLFSIFGMNHPPCHHCADWFGFPLPFYVRYLTDCELSKNISVICYTGEFSWFGTVANISIAIIFSFAVGLIFKFVREKYTAKRLK